MISSLLFSDLVWRLGWTLLHSLWQLVAIGAFAAFVVGLLSRQSANVRYRVACCGMAFFYVPLIATFVLIPPRPVTDTSPVEDSDVAMLSDVSTDETTVALATNTVSSLGMSGNRSTEVANIPETREPLKSTEKVAPSDYTQLTDKASVWLPWVVGVWGSAVGLLSLANLGGWLVVLRLRLTASLPVTDAVDKRLQQLAKKMGISQVVRLLESSQIDSPMVIGWLRPAVLFPTSLMTGLAPAELDAVLSHELAHIRRYDYLINLLQTFTETLLFYHPAVWLLSRRIRIEREFCCDDEAVSMCGDKVDYARALAAVEASRQTPQLAMSFFGRNRNMTLHRVRRIMGMPIGLPNVWLNGSGILLLMTAVLVAVVVMQSEGQAAREKSDGWGKQVEGIQVRLWTDDIHWKEDETLVFKCEVRNRGERNWLVPRAQQLCEIEFDGKWYRWNAPYSLKMSLLPPRKKYKDIRISLLDRWTSEDRSTLPLTLGKHTIRVAFPARAPQPKSPDAARPVRAISNAIEIEVVRGDKAIADSWGVAQDGLKTRLVARSKTYRAGHSISVTLEIKNFSDVVKKYGRFSVTSSDEFEVLDETGNRMAYLAGPAQLVEQATEIQPGETHTFASFDLADSYYLRKPGAYSVKLRRSALPPSGTLKFEVTPDQAGLNDPIGPLLSLRKKGWRFDAPPGAHERSPGTNWQPT
ncbi:MAG: M56 family metallopeptidase, partial [Planctomycetota bacterium]